MPKFRFSHILLYMYIYTHILVSLLVIDLCGYSLKVVTDTEKLEFDHQNTETVSMYHYHGGLALFWTWHAQGV